MGAFLDLRCHARRTLRAARRPRCLVYLCVPCGTQAVPLIGGGCCGFMACLYLQKKARRVPECLGGLSWGQPSVIKPRSCGLYRILLMTAVMGLAHIGNRNDFAAAFGPDDRAAGTQRAVTVAPSQTCPVCAYLTASKVALQLGFLTFPSAFAYLASNLCDVRQHF